MKKLFTLLAALMLTVSVGFAQQNFYFWESRYDGMETSLFVESADSVTFSMPWAVQFSKPMNITSTADTFEGYARVDLNEKIKSIPDAFAEVGICYSDVNKNPTYADNQRYLGPKVVDCIFTISELKPATTYYYRTYVRLGCEEVYYSEVNSFTTKDEAYENIVINYRHFVDLGLPSGLLWAQANVGTGLEYKYGNYFAWGETEDKNDYSRDTYKWGNFDNLSKYNSLDGKTTLDPEDDAATVNWGAPCRMPSVSEFQELCDQCEWTWLKNYYGASGYLVTGPNGNTIFLPAAGYRSDEDIDREGSLVRYWSRSLLGRYPYCAYYIWADNDEILPAGYNNRDIGLPVRPVAEK